MNKKNLKKIWKKHGNKFNYTFFFTVWFQHFLKSDLPNLPTQSDIGDNYALVCSKKKYTIY